MMFGQAIRGEHEWKSGIARRREPIFAARKPKLRWISIMRIKFIRDRGFERLVMSREGAVLQTLWHIQPTQSVLMQNKWRITWNCIESFCAYLRLVVGRLSLYKSGNIDAGPFFGVPPHQFFPFAPGATVRPRTGAVVDDAAIARPREAPAVTKIIPRFARVGLVYAIAAKNTGVNPAAARGRPVGFQFSKTIYLRAVMRC